MKPQKYLCAFPEVTTEPSQLPLLWLTTTANAYSLLLINACAVNFVLLCLLRVVTQSAANSVHVILGGRDLFSRKR